MDIENRDWKICCSRSSAQFIKFAITAFVCFSKKKDKNKRSAFFF